jgi:hypothetical protein
VKGGPNFFEWSNQMENWKVVQQTGKRAVIARDNEQREIHRPTNMNLKEFVAALPHKSTHSDEDLGKKFPDFAPTAGIKDAA